MQQSFYTALSGASTHQKGLDAWSNNIANINTTGFRYDTVEFKSLVTNSTRNDGQVSSNTINKKSFGSTALASTTSFTQSSIVNTDNEFDLSIAGSGFFVVGDVAGNLKYTRDGSFTKDRDGYLVNSSGYYLYGVDLNKIKDNALVTIKSDDELKTHDLSSFKRLRIPDNAIDKPVQTTTMDIAVNLNSKRNIRSLENAYNGMLYGHDNTFLTIRPLAEFINIKNGDKIQINTQDTQGTAYTYGTDFTNVEDLRKLILRDREDISLEIDDGRITIVNISGAKLNIDYEGSSDEVKNSFALKEAILGKGGKSPLAPFSEKQQYNTNFNALYAKNEFPVNIKKGDELKIEINGTVHTMVYGGSDEFKIGSKVISKEDSFFTIGDFIDKLEKKADLEVFMEDGRIKIQNTSSAPIDMKISSSNTNLVSDLGIRPNSTLDSDASISSYHFGVSTYTSTVNIFDNTGKKFNIRTNYVSQSSIQPDSKERWHTSLAIYDGDKLVSSKNLYGKIEFSNKGAPVSTSLFNPEDNTIKEVDKFILDFPGNESIAMDLTSDVNSKTSENFKYLNSSITGSEINGNRQGTVSGALINDQGNIIISFSNQKQEILARVGLVDFINKNGLKKTGNNMFEESYVVDSNGVKYPASGGAKALWDKQGHTSSSVGQRSVETSNVDLTRGLTQLIVMQRSFSANAKAITTSDEMIQQAINLKS